MENAELCYVMGQLWAARAKPGASERMDELLAQAVAAGLLRDHDGRGNGYSVTGDGGTLMPGAATRMVFADKGHAFLYWLGLGRPEHAILVCISDPFREEELVFARPAIINGDGSVQELEEPAPRLRLVAKAGEIVGPPPPLALPAPSDDSPDPIVAIVEADPPEEELAEILEQVEAEYGVRVVAYEPEKDLVIYGGKLLDELNRD